MKKFREVYTELGIPKSTAQKWVNEILCQSIFCKEQFQNDSNEWEFTDEEISKIWEVAFYRELDYSYKEIIVLLKSSQKDIQKIINQKFNDLIKEKERIERRIRMSKFVYVSGLKPISFKYALQGFFDIKYDIIKDLIYELIDDNSKFLGQEEIEKQLKCIDTEYVLECIDNIMLKRCMTVDYYESEVQEYIRKIHKAMYCFFGKSVSVFRGVGVLVAPGSKYALKIDEKYGIQSSEYLFNALSYYAESNIDNEFDKKYFDSMEMLIQLSEEGYGVESKEVQAQVRNIYDFYNLCIPFSNANNNIGFKAVCNIYKESQIHNKKNYNDVKFLIQAIEYFCNTEQEV